MLKLSQIGWLIDIPNINYLSSNLIIKYFLFSAFLAVVAWHYFKYSL